MTAQTQAAAAVPPMPRIRDVVIGAPTADELATLVGLAMREINAHGGPGAADGWLATGNLPDGLTHDHDVWFVDPSDPEVSQYARVWRTRVCLVRRSARAVESARARQRHLRAGGSPEDAPALCRDRTEAWASMFWDSLRKAARDAQQLAEQLELFGDQ